MEYIVNPIQVVQGADAFGSPRVTGPAQPIPTSMDEADYFDIDPNPPCAGGVSCWAAINF